jgi:hypothetical protein
MGRALTLNLAIAGGVFWVLMTWVNTGGFTFDGFKETGFQTLLFVMIYAAIRVAMIMFKGDKK